MSGLRAVELGETAKVRSLAVDVAASSGTAMELLAAMRDRIATAVADPNCPPRDLAALTRRLMEISKDIEALELRDREDDNSAVSAPDAKWSSEAI